MGIRAAGDGVQIRGHSSKMNTYDGVTLSWYNIETFSKMFLETRYMLEYHRYHRVKENNHEFTKDELKEEKRLIERLKDLYRIMTTIRINIKKLYQKVDSFKSGIDRKCTDDPKYFINQFIVTNDPRLSRFGLPTRVPLILYKSQENLIDACYEGFINGTSILAEKSRGEGATEVICGFTLWIWIYRENSLTSWSSRVKDLIDVSDDPDTIFERIRRMIGHLPNKMKHQFGKRHDKYMRITHPTTGGVIKGGGGKNALRGGRSGFVATDEAGHLQNPNEVFAAIHGNSDSDVLISTPCGRDAFFEEKERGARVVITMGWWLNPAKNPDWETGERNEKSYWYMREILENDPAILAQEVDISYDAYSEGAFIPLEWVRAAVNFVINDYDYNNKVGGLDVAAGGVDKPILTLRTDNVVNKVFELGNAYTPLGGARRAAYLAKKNNTYKINFDQTGYGEDINQEMGREFPMIKWFGVKGGRSASEKMYDGDRGIKKFRNLRAEQWWMVRQRFQRTFLHVSGEKKFEDSQLISIPNDPALINQLSSPRLLHDNGKIGIESKKSMRSRGVKSPDRADSLVYCFADEAKGIGSQSVLDAFDYTDKNINIPFKKQYNYIACKLFGAGFYTEDLSIYIVIGQYSPNNKNIKIFFAKKYENSLIKDIKMDLSNEQINVESVTWFGNDVIMDSFKDDWDSLWYNFSKEKIRFQKTYNINENYLLTQINDMFKDNVLFIHSDCKEMIDDIRFWSLEHSKEKNRFYYALTFILLISGMTNKFIKQC